MYYKFTTYGYAFVNANDTLLVQRKSHTCSYVSKYQVTKSG